MKHAGAQLELVALQEGRWAGVEGVGGWGVSQANGAALSDGRDNAIFSLTSQPIRTQRGRTGPRELGFTRVGPPSFDGTWNTAVVEE